MDEVRGRVAEFDPLLAEVDEPVLILEGEVTTTLSRLKEMKLGERRLELSADEKRVRMKQLQERMNTVRNLREEAAVQTELDLLRRALDADEQEALTLLDQIRKLEDRLQEAETGLEEARVYVEPRRRELLDGQKKALAEFSSLEDEREAYSSQVKVEELRVYEAIKAGGRSIAVSNLTDDGACGHCFNMVPLQIRTEIRSGTKMIRCEACGVILTPPGPELPEAPATQQDAPEAKVDDSEVDDSEVDDSEVGDSEVDDSEVGDAEVSPDAAAEADSGEGDG